MNPKSLFISLLLTLVLPLSVQANAETDYEEPNVLDELNPFDPNIEEKLRELDEAYERETGKSPYLPDLNIMDGVPMAGCYRLTCTVYAMINKSEQKMYLYINGRMEAEWLVSTGVSGYRTPDFDTHPNGRIYDKYSSTRYPGGDYKGLGNMPYAVFIRGGFAIHGTTKGNWPKLGSPASHGCIRLHPDNGYRFNRLVRQYGINDVWITVQ